jgi:hypothetical protein
MSSIHNQSIDDSIELISNLYNDNPIEAEAIQNKIKTVDKESLTSELSSVNSSLNKIL